MYLTLQLALLKKIWLIFLSYKLQPNFKVRFTENMLLLNWCKAVVQLSQQPETWCLCCLTLQPQTGQQGWQKEREPCPQKCTARDVRHSVTYLGGLGARTSGVIVRIFQGAKPEGPKKRLCKHIQKPCIPRFPESSSIALQWSRPPPSESFFWTRS